MEAAVIDRWDRTRDLFFLQDWDLRFGGNMNFPAFFITLFFGIVLLFVLQGPPGVDLFEDGTPRVGLGDLPVTDLASVKFRHAARSKPFSVGLFGNSRIEETGSSHLGLPEGEFFNFSLQGTSLRQTVLLLEMLGEVDKIPRMVLISLDNILLQAYLNPWFPKPPGRWRQSFRDLLAPLHRKDIPVREIAVMAYRHLLTEWWMFAGVFDVRLLSTRLSCCRNNGAAAVLADGSRPDMVRAPHPSPIRIPKVQEQAVLDGYLAYDLERLKRLDGHGTRIVVYESPLHPAAFRPATPGESRTRNLVFKTCAELALECLPAPSLGDDGRPPYWKEASHPPPRYLAPWLSEVIAASSGQRK